MNNCINSIPEPVNEPVKQYLPGSRERKQLKAELDRQIKQTIDIPLIINGREIRTKDQIKVVCPHDHGHILAHCSMAGKKETGQAVQAALAAKKKWESMPWTERASIFLKTAELISQKYSARLNAATMLGQSKNAFQAEIDSTCELVDFLRYNAKYMEEIYSGQPGSEKGEWNRSEYRALEGFVFAVTPFNFTAIAGNLPSAPAMMGNTIVWKPSSTAVLSGYTLMRIFMEAGLPGGVINFIPGTGSTIADAVLGHRELAGIHFTGSTAVFQHLWKEIGARIETYRSYPRIVGETGGKDFIFMHPSANLAPVVTAAVRSAFEYQGQKCSAASRMYVPKSREDDFLSALKSAVNEITLGDVRDFKHFMNAMIDETAYDKAVGYIMRARESKKAKIIAGGTFDESKGYFIDPTVILTTDPHYESMTQEIFAPVLTIYVYADDSLDQALELVDTSSDYALTGAVFATDRQAVVHMTRALAHSAGNFYINDKPTGSVVGRQPFGGARGSGTNDKAGSYMNMLRWTSVRTIKETFVPPEHFAYPFMAGDEKK